MKITEKQIKSLYITELEDLDPVEVIIDQMKPKVAEVVIKCYGQSWTHYWGGMGCDTLEEFWLSCDNDYLARCLIRATAHSVSEVDWDEIPNKMIKEVLKSRRMDHISKDRAREAYEYIRRYSFNEATTTAFNHPLMDEDHSFSEYKYDWYLYLPTRYTHDYKYLLRIVDAVRQAFSQLKEQE